MNDSLRIFVGGLGMSTFSNDIKEYFSKWGEITEAVVVIEKKSNISKGFGFITCNERETFEKILKTNHKINKRMMFCREAFPIKNTNQFGDPEDRKVYIRTVPNEVNEGMLILTN